MSAQQTGEMAGYSDDQRMVIFAHRALMTQGQRASDGLINACKYRASNGLKCGIGHCISDADYSSSMDTDSGLGPPGCLRGDIQDAWRKNYPAASTTVAVSIQSIHDQYSPSEWPAKFTTLAVQVGLTPADLL